MTNYQVQTKINTIFNKIFDFLYEEEKTNLDYITLVEQKVMKTDSGISDIGVTTFIRDIKLNVIENGKTSVIFINGASLMNQAMKIKLTETNEFQKTKTFDFETKFEIKNFSEKEILSTIGSVYQKLSKIPISDIKKPFVYNEREILINGYELYFDTTKRNVIKLILDIGIKNNILKESEISFVEYHIGLKEEWLCVDKNVHSKISSDFEKLSDFLVSNENYENNHFMFNDFDNKSYFIEQNGIKGIALKNQTTCFFIAQKDDKIKVWLSPFLSDGWASELESDMSLDYDFKDAYKVDALETFRSYFQDNHYYAIPMLFERDDYPKTCDQLIANFEYDNKDYLLYDSEYGFNNSISNIYSRLILSELSLTLENTKYI